MQRHYQSHETPDVAIRTKAPFERDEWDSFSVALQTRKEQFFGTRMKGEINPEMDKIMKRSQGLR